MDNKQQCPRPDILCPREPIATFPIGRNCPDFGTGISINRSFYYVEPLKRTTAHSVLETQWQI